LLWSDGTINHTVTLFSYNFTLKMAATAAETCWWEKCN